MIKNSVSQQAIRTQADSPSTYTSMPISRPVSKLLTSPYLGQAVTGSRFNILLVIHCHSAPPHIQQLVRRKVSLKVKYQIKQAVKSINSLAPFSQALNQPSTFLNPPPITRPLSLPRPRVVAPVCFLHVALGLPLLHGHRQVVAVVLQPAIPLTIPYTQTLWLLRTTWKHTTNTWKLLNTGRSISHVLLMGESLRFLQSFLWAKQKRSHCFCTRKILKYCLWCIIILLKQLLVYIINKHLQIWLCNLLSVRVVKLTDIRRLHCHFLARPFELLQDPGHRWDRHLQHNERIYKIHSRYSIYWSKDTY